MNGAERLLRTMGKMMEQIQDTADIVYGEVAETWPLKINVGGIQIDENFIVTEPQVLITMQPGESVRMLRTNHGQKFYILKIVDPSGEIGWSNWAWVPDIAQDGTITWARTETQSVPRSKRIKGPIGARGTKGEPGEPGEPGDKGPTGYRGMKGQKGLPGPQGETGIKGLPGEDGKNGLKGLLGDRGQQGDAGEKGVGLPEGGTEGQAAQKISGYNYEMHWATLALGDMKKQNYDPNSEVPNLGGLGEWLNIHSPFLHDILDIQQDEPVPAMKNGDILLIY